MRIEVPGTLFVLDGEPGGRVELLRGWRDTQRVTTLGRDEVRWLREALEAFEVSPSPADPLTTLCACGHVQREHVKDVFACFGRSCFDGPCACVRFERG